MFRHWKRKHFLDGGVQLNFLTSLLRVLIRLKAAIVGIFAFVAGVICIVVAGNMTADDASSKLLDAVTSGVALDAVQATNLIDQVATGAVPSVVLTNLGGNLIGIGVIAVGWDLWLNFSWIRLVREELFAILANADAIQNVRPERQQELLEGLLIARHGKELGEALHKEGELMHQGARMMRSDFVYNIAIEPLNAHHHQAQFFIQFTLREVKLPIKIHFSQVNDGLEFHGKYEDLLNASPNALYRYVLLSNKQALSHSFTVVSADVQGSGESVTLVASSPSIGPLGQEFELKPDQDKKKLLNKIVAGEIRVTLRILTIVDIDRKEFPIWLGYPVREFRSHLTMQGVGVTEVDVLEFFTSFSRFKREDIPQNQQLAGPNVSASGALKDLIFPNSGLTYVWR